LGFFKKTFFSALQETGSGNMTGSRTSKSDPVMGRNLELIGTQNIFYKHVHVICILTEWKLH